MKLRKDTMADPVTEFDKVIKARLDEILGKIDALYREGDAVVAVVRHLSANRFASLRLGLH